MGFKRLLIAAVVLAGLGGALLWSDRQEKANEGKPAKDAPPQILALKEDTIQQVELKSRTGDATVVRKTGPAEWKITAPRQLIADSAAVMAVVGAVTSLSSERLVDENASGLAAYGLDPAVTMVTFTQTDGKAHVLRIGDPTPTGGSVYASVDGSKKLYTMSASVKETLSKSLGDLREKHLLAFDQEKLSRVELTAAGKGAIEFGRTGANEWQILKPRPLRADGWQVEEILTKLKQVTMNPEVDEKAAASGFASSAPVATVRVTGADGTKSIEIRKNQDDVYAKAGEGAYKVGKEAAEGLDKGVDDFRAKKVFDFGFNDPSRIEARNGDKAVAVEKSGEKWKSGAKEMDSVGVQNLIDKLRDLSAAKFADSGFTTPALELTVVSGEGKRTEKVQISQAGERYLAKRENDTTLYELGKDTVSDLRQSIDGVREVAPPSDAKKK